MTDQAIARRIATFADQLVFEDLPAEVVERSMFFMLDCVGIAFASTAFDFAPKALTALSSLGMGPHPVIGYSQSLNLRDATMLNGILVHGLDYDDTHTGGVCHASASAFPTALGVAAANGLSGRDVLLGYVLAIEVSTRLGIAANGEFHNIGFHPTGVTGAFGSAVAAARLFGCNADGITTAQGIVGSTASGLLEFLEDGSWTKRAHPGHAAASAITAAAFARQGWQGPESVYEGRFGLFNTHIQSGNFDLTACTKDLGQEWEVLNNAIKPYPACHFTHAFADAALELVKEHDLHADDIEKMICLIHPTPAAVVCEPPEKKLVPKSDYDAKFSLPFVVAATIVRRGFGLNELRPDALNDREILDLASRVGYGDDPKSGFPRHFSGELIITTTDGRDLRHREQVNRGADQRPLSGNEISAKFHENMATVTSRSVADRIETLVLAMDQIDSAAELADGLRS